MIDNNIEGNEMENNFENEFTTDAVTGIMPRNYQDTLVTREIPNNYGYYNEAGEYVENGTFTITHYQYAHNAMDLYRANENQPRLNVENYNNTSFNKDVFFAMSRGVHRGVLKRGKFDERENFINKLIKVTPNVRFDLYGMNGVQPVWADNFLLAISQSKIGSA